MFKVTFKTPSQSVNFFKWFKNEQHAKTFAFALDDRFIKMEKL
jgi:hypothetical protein